MTMCNKKVQYTRTLCRTICRAICTCMSRCGLYMSSYELINILCISRCTSKNYGGGAILFRHRGIVVGMEESGGGGGNYCFVKKFIDFVSIYVLCSGFP